MEPLPPAFRELLKENHPGVTDEEIDLVEQLLAQRFLVDPRQQPEQLRALDRERERLIEQRMPRFQDLWIQFRAREEEGEGESA